MRGLYIRELVMRNNRLEELEIPDERIEAPDPDGKPTLFNVGVDRETVEKGRVQPILEMLDRVEKRKHKGHKTVNFGFFGYDADPRSIYQIPEIRNWVGRIYKNKPHLFYFITNLGGSMEDIFKCICQIDVKDRWIDKLTGEEMQAIQLIGGKQLVEKVTASAVSFSKKIKDDPVTQYKVADYIMQNLHYDQLSADSMPDDYTTGR